MDKRFKRVLATITRQTATRRVPSKFVATSRYVVANSKSSIFLYEKQRGCRDVAIVAGGQKNQMSLTHAS